MAWACIPSTVDTEAGVLLEGCASWDSWWVPDHLGLHRSPQFKNKNNKEKTKEEQLKTFYTS